MAVLVEAISVVVRRDAIDKKFDGGWQGFQGLIPNDTLCVDGELVRVGFMSPDDVEAFVERLVECGLTFVDEGLAVDISVVDQMRGPTVTTEWLEFGHLSLDGAENKVAACWLFEGPRMASGLHFSSREMTFATPHQWKYEDSLSANFRFVEDGEKDDKLEHLRHEDGIDVYLNLETGKEVYVGRTKD